MYVGEQLTKKEFTGKTTKDAFLKASKWIANHLVAKDQEHICYRIEKAGGQFGEKKVRVYFYVMEQEEGILEQNCKVCQEVNNHFYMKENRYMCYTCRVNPYRERIKGKLKKIAEGEIDKFYEDVENDSGNHSGNS